MEKNRIKINIAGSSYVILSDESEGYVRSIADEINSKVELIGRKSSDISNLMAAILTAMDFCDLYKKTIKIADEMERNYKNYASVNERLRKENSGLRRIISGLEAKLEKFNVNSEK